MNLNQFLIKIFELFPPNEGENTGNLLGQYIQLMQTTKNYDYEKAAKDFVMTYKYRKLPTIAALSEFLQGYIIKNNDVIEYRDIHAWWNNSRYTFAYNPKEQSYEEVKRDLVNQGLRVFDSEQKEYV